MPDTEPTTAPSETSATCDWGDCEYTSKFWRINPETGDWLPVCFAHSENGEKFYAGLNHAYRITRGASA